MPAHLMMSRLRFAAGLALLGVVCLIGGLNGSAWGQSSGKSKGGKANAGAASVKSLNQKADQLQDTFIRQTFELSQEYAEAGQYRQARELLESLKKLKNDLPGLDDRIRDLSERQLTTGEQEFELDVSQGWVATGFQTVKDQLARIEVEGEYKFSVTATVGASGWPTKNYQVDSILEAPTGAVIAGLLVNNKLAKPFNVGNKLEWVPKEEAPVMLKINVPDGHRCTGKLKVRLGGLRRHG